MKKEITALLTAGLMLTSTVLPIHGVAYTEKQQRIADALNHVELFLGTNIGYELDRQLTRAEGIVLLVRMLGEEDMAKEVGYPCPFTDVLPWAEDYIGYAYAKGITKGVSATEFEPDEIMTDFMFLTLTLRALGFSDSGETPQFVWDNPYAFANSVGLIAKEQADTDFIRGDAIEVFWNALAREKYQLAEALIAKGAFTAAAFEESKAIFENGKTEEKETTKPETSGEDDEDDWIYPDDDVPFLPDEPDDRPETNRPETNRPETNRPETNRPETNLPESNRPETNKPETNPPETNPPATNNPDAASYEAYLAMSGEEQSAFINSFSSTTAFFEWRNAAKAAYEAQNPDIEIGNGGSIDLGGK